MKNIYSLLLFIFLSLSTQVNGQVAGSFQVGSMKWRWGATTVNYLNNNGFTTGAQIMSHSVIYGSGDENRANLDKVRAWLINEYSTTASTGYLLINWETGPFLTMKNNPKTSSAFQAAEYEIIRLLREVKESGPT